MAPERIYVTREQFTQMFGFQPDPDAVGMRVMSPPTRRLIHGPVDYSVIDCSFLEYVFIDTPDPAAQRDISELEKLWQLPSQTHPFQNGGATSGICTICGSSVTDHTSISQ
jgi:hypothetical protein